MNQNLAFEFSVNKETNTITVIREFDAELPLVWDAWTKPEILDQWWGSESWKSETKSMEFKKGGRRFYVMHGPEGAEHWGITSYDKIDVLKGFSGIDCFSNENGEVNKDHPESTYGISFTENGEKTLVKHFTTYPELAQLDASIEYGFKEGMTMAFEGLDRVLAS